MKRHETLPDTLVATDDSFVISKEQLRAAMYLMRDHFEDDFRKADHGERLGIAGASLAVAAGMTREFGEELYTSNPDFQMIVANLVEGFALWLAIKAAAS